MFPHAWLDDRAWWRVHAYGIEWRDKSGDCMHLTRLHIRCYAYYVVIHGKYFAAHPNRRYCRKIIYSVECLKACRHDDVWNTDGPDRDRQLIYPPGSGKARHPRTCVQRESTLYIAQSPFSCHRSLWKMLKEKLKRYSLSIHVKIKRQDSKVIRNLVTRMCWNILIH